MVTKGDLVPTIFHLKWHLVHHHCYGENRLHVIGYLNGDFLNSNKFFSGWFCSCWQIMRVQWWKKQNPISFFSFWITVIDIWGCCGDCRSPIGWVARENIWGMGIGSHCIMTKLILLSTGQHCCFCRMTEMIWHCLLVSEGWCLIVWVDLVGWIGCLRWWQPLWQKFTVQQCFDAFHIKEWNVVKNGVEMPLTYCIKGYSPVLLNWYEKLVYIKL